MKKKSSLIENWEETTICSLCGKVDCECDLLCPCQIHISECDWPSDTCPCPICDELMKNCECNIIKKEN